MKTTRLAPPNEPHAVSRVTELGRICGLLLAIALLESQGHAAIPGTAEFCANAHSSLQAQDAIPALVKFQSFSLRGAYVAAGVAMRNRGYGHLSVTNIPAGSTVVAAYLYWDILHYGWDDSLPQCQFDGNAISGQLVAMGGEPCWYWGHGTNFAFRADVTGLVTNNGTFFLSGFASGTVDGSDPWRDGSGSPMVEGASLVIIYENPSYPETTVLIYEGATLTTSDLLETTIEGFVASTNTFSAITTFIGADGQDTYEPGSTFNGTFLPSVGWDGEDPQAGPEFSHLNLWDTMTVDVTSLIGHGDTNATATVQGGTDCLVWVAQVFAISSAPWPVTAPPRLQYLPAIRGLHMWTPAAPNGRNLLASPNDGTMYRMWLGNASSSTPVDYSFTIASNRIASHGFPETNDWASFTTGQPSTNVWAALFLVPANQIGYAVVIGPYQDWVQPDCIWLQVGWTTTTPPVGFCTFHWKTNSPYSYGQYFLPGNQITITNPTPCGKWTLRFTDYNKFSLIAPLGNTTNVTMGVDPSVPDISGNFPDPGGSVYFGVLNNADPDSFDQDVVFTATAVGPGNFNMNGFNTDWLTATNIEPFDPWLHTNQWLRICSAPCALVTTNNAWWVNWSLPDWGFALQTNTVSIELHDNWSTNHGLPAGTVLGTRKRLLIKPGDLPDSSQLYFRLSSPGY